jgi:uncharacterized protein
MLTEIEIEWSSRWTQLLQVHSVSDAAHDLGHIQRVVANARRLSVAEGADWEVVMPAAWLHDCVNVPKSSPERRIASRLCAVQACAWLEADQWPYGKLEEIFHAIEAHSYSAEIVAESLEAKVMQDADRLDALGAVGLARTLMLGAEMKREFYHSVDPFCDQREADDSLYTLDHVFRKLLKLESTMQTPSGRSEAAARTDFLRDFIRQMRSELGFPI